MYTTLFAKNSVYTFLADLYFSNKYFDERNLLVDCLYDPFATKIKLVKSVRLKSYKKFYEPSEPIYSIQKEKENNRQITRRSQY